MNLRAQQLSVRPFAANEISKLMVFNGMLYYKYYYIKKYIVDRFFSYQKKKNWDSIM